MDHEKIFHEAFLKYLGETTLLNTMTSLMSKIIITASMTENPRMALSYVIESLQHEEESPLIEKTFETLKQTVEEICKNDHTP